MRRRRPLELYRVAVEAMVMAPRIRRDLRRHGYKATAADWAARSGRHVSTGPTELDPGRIARVVNRTVTLLGGNCLDRTLTGWVVLRRRGVDAEIRFGVRPADPPAFHSWLELDGRVLNDRPDVAQHYLPFSGAKADPAAFD